MVSEQAAKKSLLQAREELSRTQKAFETAQSELIQLKNRIGILPKHSAIEVDQIVE